MTPTFDGCRVYEIIYLGSKVLVLENEILRIALLYEYGGTVIEFRYKSADTDVVWRTPLWRENLRRRSVLFPATAEALSDNYLGGWFDIFPSFGPSRTFEDVTYPAHGELLYLPWGYRICRNDKDCVEVILYTWLSKQAVYVEKTIRICSGSAKVECGIKIHNDGAIPIPYQWGIHPTLGAPFLSEHCEIQIGGESLGYFPPVGSGVERMFPWAGNGKGECKVLNHLINVQFIMTWDEKTFPYTLVWISGLDVKGHHLRGGTYALCILPISDLSDGLSYNSARLSPGGTLHTSYSMEIGKGEIV